jgi:hypothetical protein
MKPQARLEELLIQEVGDELVLYDQRRHRAHHLNRTAALVWQSCLGESTVAQLARQLRDELGGSAAEAMVWQALERLGKAHLLTEPVRRPAGAGGMSRRQALRQLVRAAALVLVVPAVTSVAAPQALADTRFYSCSSRVCLVACANQCRTNADCSPTAPVCRQVQCRQPHCPCTQRRCVKPATTIRF